MERVGFLSGETLRQRCVEAVVDEGGRFGILAQELATDGGLDTAVPWVPEWTARDLVGHLGTVHRWATAIVRAGSTAPPPRSAAQQPPSDGLVDWYAAGLVDLVRALREVPPASPAWHMSPTAEKVAASWARRQAHELVVHRMDLESAAGRAISPVEPSLAEDGVDELLTIVVPRWAHTEPLTSARAAVVVTATDTGRTWAVQVDRGAVAVSPTASRSVDASLRAPADQLLRRLWGRPAEVAVDGDPAAEALLRGR